MGHRVASREFIDEELATSLLKRVLRSNYQDLEALTELRFITKFNNEFYKNVLKKGDPTALHSSDTHRKDCYDRENSRNRDVLSIFRGSTSLPAGQIFEIRVAKEQLDNSREDTLIELMELKGQPELLEFFLVNTS